MFDFWIFVFSQNSVGDDDGGDSGPSPPPAILCQIDSINIGYSCLSILHLKLNSKSFRIRRYIVICLNIHHFDFCNLYVYHFK